MPKTTLRIAVEESTQPYHLSSNAAVWLKCPLCRHYTSTSADYSNALHGAGCLVRFDRTTKEWCVPLEDVPRMVAKRLKGEV